jgi:hypothetical protein
MLPRKPSGKIDWFVITVPFAALWLIGHVIGLFAPHLGLCIIAIATCGMMLFVLGESSPW